MAGVITVPGMFLTGTHAARPAASAVGKGSLYACSDHKLIYQSDGSSWTTWIDASGSGGSAGNLQAGKVKRTSGDFSTASTSFVDVTGMSVTITTGARRCLVAAIVHGQANNVAATSEVTLDIDGTDQGGAANGLIALGQAVVSETMNFSFTFLTDVLSAASHTFKLRARVLNAAHTFTINATDPPCVLSVVELYAA